MAENALVPLFKLTKEQVAAEASVGRWLDMMEEARDGMLILIKTKIWESYNLTKEDYFWQRYRKTWHAIQRHQSTTNKTICETKTLEEANKPKPVYGPGWSNPSAQPDPADHDEIFDSPPPDDIFDNPPVNEDAEPPPQKPKPAVIGDVDRAGHAVPACLKDVFDAARRWMELRQEVISLGRLIGSQVKLSGGEGCATIRSLVAIKRDDKGRVVQASCTPANDMAEDIEQGAPYSVCPTCKGQCVITDEVCITCDDLGWVTMGQWMNCDNKDDLEAA